MLDTGPAALLLALGGTATMDAGAGLLELVHELPVPARVACDVTATLGEAPRLFGPQKGAGREEIAELERRSPPRRGLCCFNTSPVAALRVVSGPRSPPSVRELVPGAALVLDAIGFDPFRLRLVVTGEGRVDATTALGKAPGEVARRRSAGTRCVVFGGLVEPSAAGSRDGRALGRSGSGAGRPG